MSYKAKESKQDIDNAIPRRGATYTVDKDGSPVRPRYRPRTNADDTVRLPPVVVGTRVAAPVVKQMARDRRINVVSAMDLYNEEPTVQITKETQDRYKAIKEQYRLEQDMAELQKEMRKREDAEAKLAAQELEKEHKKTIKPSQKVEDDKGLKSEDIGDIQFSPSRVSKPRHSLPSKTPEDEENLDDIINEILAPEPELPRQSRHKAVKHATTAESLRTQQSNVETPTTKALAIIKDKDHATKLADFYHSLEAIEEWKKRYALATVRVFSGAFNDTNAKERTEVIQDEVKPVSKDIASCEAKHATKEIALEPATNQINVNSENSEMAIREYTLKEALQAVNPSETSVDEEIVGIDASLDDEPRSPSPCVEVKKINRCKKIWENVKKFLCCCG